MSDLWDTIRAQLEEKGIDVDALCSGDPESARVKVICVAAGMGESLKELGQATRDQVVMVRVDEQTSKALDAWVETGVVKSRSEAAALFIREGLKVLACELEHLADAQLGVEKAKERLRQKASDVFGETTNES